MGNINYGTIYSTPCQRRHFIFEAFQGNVPIQSRLHPSHGCGDFPEYLRGDDGGIYEPYLNRSNNCIRETTSMTPSTNNRSDTKILVRPRWAYKNAGGTSTDLTPTGTTTTHHLQP